MRLGQAKVATRVQAGFGVRYMYRSEGFTEFSNPSRNHFNVLGGRKVRGRIEMLVAKLSVRSVSRRVTIIMAAGGTVVTCPCYQCWSAGQTPVF